MRDRRVCVDAVDVDSGDICNVGKLEEVDLKINILVQPEKLSLQSWRK
jgi:hypothetical protein